MIAANGSKSSAMPSFFVLSICLYRLLRIGNSLSVFCVIIKLT